jgi:hypothetical protein
LEDSSSRLLAKVYPLFPCILFNRFELIVLLILKLNPYEIFKLTILGSRLAAMAALKAAVKYLVFIDSPVSSTEMRTLTSSQATQLGYYLVVFFLVEIGFRMLIYYIVRMVKYMIIDEGIPSGCYESIK